MVFHPTPLCYHLAAQRFSIYPFLLHGLLGFNRDLRWLQRPCNTSFVKDGLTAIFRAVRLVVDTGMHHKRWTREEGIDYMSRNTGMAMSDVVAEIERYLVMPGQATAYKVGMIKILELRSYAQEQLQEDFDIREFHDVVLKNGGLPLSLLEEVVKWVGSLWRMRSRRWIKHLA